MGPAYLKPKAVLKRTTGEYSSPERMTEAQRVMSESIQNHYPSANKYQIPDLVSNNNGNINLVHCYFRASLIEENDLRN